MSELIIKKASGDEQVFDVKKLERSLVNAGADKTTISNIVEDIDGWAYNGVSTKEIYTRAFSFLHKDKNVSASRYKLKQAIMELGPTGFPFERFIGQIFEKQNYETQVGIVVVGNCVTHEMDVIATRQKKQYLVECKYGRDQGKHVSVQVPLYVRSRVNDIISKRKEMKEYQGFDFYGSVVTNTRFSEDSIKYGTCSGLYLLAWDYPVGKGLKDLIEKYKLYPITILNHLSNDQKHKLLEKGVVSCPQLLNDFSSIKFLDLSELEQRSLLEELNAMCG